MKFRNLLKTVREFDANVKNFGAEENAMVARERLSRCMNEHYTDSEIDSPDFQKREVPDDVLEVYLPLEEMFREFEKYFQEGQE